MAVIAKTLYGTDFAEWAAQTAELLRQRRFDEIDVENVAEEKCPFTLDQILEGNPTLLHF
jgi:hypothetical protein